MRDFKNIEKINNGKKNCYEIIVDFMVGDADGEKTLKFKFDKDKLEDKDFQEYVSDFIDSINGCIKLDSVGRCGFADVDECTEWYAGGFDRCGDQYKGVPSWSRFCHIAQEYGEDEYGEDEYVDEGPIIDKNGNDVEMEKFQEKDNPFAYYIPSETYGHYCSYDSIDMIYYDEVGEKHKVNI